MAEVGEAQSQTGTGAPELGALRSKKPRSLWGDAWRQFRKHRLALGGLVVLGILSLLTLIGPFVWGGDTTINFARSTQGVSLTNPMGTDDLGRDIMWRVLWGGRISLAVGVAAMAVAISLGIMVGAM
jgi:peptide/nickel transport system permease protein